MSLDSEPYFCRSRNILTTDAIMPLVFVTNKGRGILTSTHDTDASQIKTTNRFSILRDIDPDTDTVPHETNKPRHRQENNVMSKHKISQNNKQKNTNKVYKNRHENKKKDKPTNSSIGGKENKISNKRMQYNLKSTNLKCLVINFQSLSNKLAEFSIMTQNEKPDIIIATETWLNDSIKNTELLLDDYDLHRRDRTHKNGGGVLLAVRKDLEGKTILSSKTTESIYSKVKINDRKSLIIGAIYRPPDNDSNYSTEICEEIHKIALENKNSLFWIGGDFNLPDIDWSTETILGHQYKRCINETFLDKINELGWKQINKTPTRGNNILDLFITSNPGLITTNTIIPGVGDHDAIKINSNMNTIKKKPNQREILLWKKCNIDKLQKDVLEYRSKFLLEFKPETNINDTWTDIKENIMLIIKKHVPSKLTSTRFQQPWFNTNTKRLINKKKRWFYKMKNSNSENVHNKYKEIKRKTQQACRKAHAEYVNNMINEDEPHNKKLWAYIRSKRQENLGIPDLKPHDSNRLIQDPKDKANLLNTQFSSVFSNPEPKIQHNIAIKDRYPEMQPIKVSKAGVLKLLLNINEHKATGPDEISGKILKTCANELCEIYQKLFQASLDQGQVPDDWKKANIVPLFKKGDRTKPENYRPVSLTSISCKLLEHIIHSNIMDHLDKYNILTSIQHGFRQKRSCESQLITTLHDFNNSLNDRGQTDAILLDFSKAFDKVDHIGLITKLKQYGITKSLLNWNESFLLNRTQKVIVDGQESDPSPVISGVPQGTVLGPLFFLIYINDIGENLTPGTTLRLFADDSLLYRNIKDRDDCQILQKDLDNLQKWENKWKMEFHPDKCQVLTISNKKQNIKSDYTIHNQTLKTTNNAKYLGVIIDDKLKWKEQHKAVCKKANNLLAFFKRNLSSCPQHVKTKCCNALLKPVLEYGSCVWDPHQQTQIKDIEKVHKNAARFVTNNHSYTTGSTKINMNKLGWIPLEEQRAKHKITTFYKAMHNEIKIPIEGFKMKNTYRCTRTGCLTYNIPTSRIDCHLHSFFPSTIRLWNNLPSDIKLSNNSEVFKRKLHDTTLKVSYK